MSYYGGAYQQHPYSGQQQPAYGQQYQQPYQQPAYNQPHLQQYNQQWQQSQHYGQYGSYYQQNVFSVQAHQAFQFNSVDELRHVFMSEMSKNPENQSRNAIQAEDLVNILNNTPSIRNHFRVNWSRELCSIMIAMLDKSQDGFMQWEEFLELQQCLVAWHNVFCQHDANRSGYIESCELVRVITGLFGRCLFNLFSFLRSTPSHIHIEGKPSSMDSYLLYYNECNVPVYSRVVPPGRCLVAFDDFVSVSVRLRAYTDAFRKRDALSNGGETGRSVFGYDDFLRCVMCL
ncbi:sorcin-like [Haliotis rubra]|uniref:sorcin-like n=1 Tax=Haliotis rubra TaxID=36100 RepID=UPI001EE5EA42|nr:sorcin-like [Haliotis rubra]